MTGCPDNLELQKGKKVNKTNSKQQDNLSGSLEILNYYGCRNISEVAAPIFSRKEETKVLIKKKYSN